MTLTDRALASFDALLPRESPVCKVCDNDLDLTESGRGGCRHCAAEAPGERCIEDFGCACLACLAEEDELDEAEEDEEAALPLALVGSVATILLFLWLSAPASPAEAFSARGSGEAGAFVNAPPA